MPIIDSSTAYLEPSADVLAGLDTTELGLTTAQADAHRAQYGSNVIVELKKESGFRRYIRQFKDWMIALLLASASVAEMLRLFPNHALSARLSGAGFCDTDLPPGVEGIPQTISQVVERQQRG